MPAHPTLSYMAPAAQDEVKARAKFVMEHKHKVPGLGSQVARATGRSATTVSLVLNGKYINPEIIRAAHQILSVRMGLPDPGNFDSHLAGTISPETAELIAAGSQAREAEALFRQLLLKINEDLRELENLRMVYRIRLSTLQRHLERPDGFYPDIIDTSIRESMLRFISADSQPKTSDPAKLIPGVKGLHETEPEFAIRQLQELGYITESGHIPTEPESVGSYVDEGTGEVVLVPRD